MLDNKLISFLKNSAATENNKEKTSKHAQKSKDKQKNKNNRHKNNHADKNKNKNNKYNNNHANKINKPNNKSKLNKNQQRKYMYARCQELYKECPKKLADLIVNSDEFTLKPPIPPPQSHAIKNQYAEIWGISGPENIPLKFNNLSLFKLIDFFRPVTAHETALKIKKIKTNTAAGVDGIKKHHLLATGVPLILASLVNMVLYSNHYPGSWKMNRTTLIPKPNKDLNNIGNWWPITISFLLSRIFSSIIDARIRTVVVQNLRQKGFTSDNGCAQNTALLDNALSTCKLNRGGVFTISYISKAFDTVPHKLIDIVLNKRGVMCSVFWARCNGRHLRPD